MSDYSRLVIVSAPSGGGKGTLIGRLKSDLHNVWVSISATTRAPRGEEKEGEAYYFLSKEDFLNMINNDEFLEYAEYSGNFYGTPKKYIDEHLSVGDIVILEIEVQGAMQIKEKCHECKMLFIEPPSLEILEKRLRGRNTDDEEMIKKRIETADRELKYKDRYDKIIINDDLDIAYEQFKNYFLSL